MTTQRRTFNLHIDGETADHYTVALHVATNGTSKVVAHLDHARVDRLRPALLGAVTGSKHARTVLSPRRRAPIPLAEDAGVRLALVALATAPLAKAGRVDAVRHGIDTMTNEEALYWYALCTGPNARRALRALRTLLAEE